MSPLRLFLAMVVAIAVLGGCGSSSADGGSQGTPDEVTGPIVKVNSEGLGQVESFEVRSSGETYLIYIDPEVDYGFNLDHLHEHLASGEPVRVELSERHRELFALSIVDV